MKKVIIYSKPSCGHCRKAKEFLDSKGVVYEERVIGLRYTGEQVREHCTRLKEGIEIRTVPQIILIKDSGEEVYIGGHSDLLNFKHLL